MPKLRIVLDKNPGMAVKRPGSKLIVLNKNGYTPKTGDEKKFSDLHKVQRWDDRNGNGDEIFKGSGVKYYTRGSNRFGYDPGKDQDAEFVASKDRTVQHVATESEEQLDEIGIHKISSYLFDKAPQSKEKYLKKAKFWSGLGFKKKAAKLTKKASNRSTGMQNASKRFRMGADKFTSRPNYYVAQEADQVIKANREAADKKRLAANERRRNTRAAKKAETAAVATAPKVTKPKKTAAKKSGLNPDRKKLSAKDLTAEQFLYEFGQYNGKPLARKGNDVVASTNGTGNPSKPIRAANENKPKLLSIKRKKSVTDSGTELPRGDYSQASGGQMNGGLHEGLILERTEKAACELAQHLADYHMEPCFVHKFKGRDGNDVHSVIRKRDYDNSDNRFYGFDLTKIIKPTPPKPIKWPNSTARKIAKIGESEDFSEARRTALQKFYEKKMKLDLPKKLQSLRAAICY